MMADKVIKEFKLKKELEGKTLTIPSIKRSFSNEILLADPITYCKKYGLTYAFELTKAQVKYIQDTDLRELRKQLK